MSDIDRRQHPRRRHSATWQDVRRLRSPTARQFGILGALVVIIIVLPGLTGGKTLDPGNLINMVNGNSYVLILAIGMVMVIIAGHIDLSVGSVAAFVGIIVAECDERSGTARGRSRSCSASSSARWSAPGRASGSPTSASPRSS